MIALSLLVLLSVLLLPLEAFSAVPSTRRSFLAISSIGMSSSQQVDNELRFWNREEGTAQALRPSSPIRKQAKIVVVSDPVDPDLTPLSAPLPDGSEILQTENRLNEVDFDLLREQECNVAVASYGPDTRAIITELVQNVPSLEWIHLRSAGIDFCTSPELAQWKGTVTNAKGQFSSTLAEYSMMACSFFAKDLPLLMKNKVCRFYGASIESNYGSYKCLLTVAGRKLRTGTGTRSWNFEEPPLAWLDSVTLVGHVLSSPRPME